MFVIMLQNVYWGVGVGWGVGEYVGTSPYTMPTEHVSELLHWLGCDWESMTDIYIGMHNVCVYVCLHVYVYIVLCVSAV